MRIHTPLRKEAPTKDVELRDLLDRILDKGLFLDSTTMLLLGEINLSHPGTRMRIGSIQETGFETLPARAKRRRRK